MVPRFCLEGGPVRCLFRYTRFEFSKLSLGNRVIEAVQSSVESLFCKKELLSIVLTVNADDPLNAVGEIREPEIVEVNTACNHTAIKRFQPWLLLENDGKQLLASSIKRKRCKRRIVPFGFPSRLFNVCGGLRRIDWRFG